VAGGKPWRKNQRKTMGTMGKVWENEEKHGKHGETSANPRECREKIGEHL